MEDKERFKWWEYLTAEDLEYGDDYVPTEKDRTESGFLLPPKFHNLMEYLTGGFETDWLPFDDHMVQIHFPVLKGTKYAITSGEINPKWIPLLGKAISSEPYYDSRLSKLLNLQ